MTASAYLGGLQQAGQEPGLKLPDEGGARLETDVVEVGRRDVIPVFVPPAPLARAAVQELESLAGALRGHSVLGQEGVEIHLGDRAPPALDPDQLGRRPLQLGGNLLLGQPAFPAQADKLTTEKSALNKWSLINGHTELLSSA